MQEQNDKALHDWVRQSLAQHQPVPEPQEWIHMRRRLRHRFWWRMAALGFGCILLVCISMIWLYREAPKENEEKESITSQIVQTEEKKNSATEKSLPADSVQEEAGLPVAGKSRIAATKVLKKQNKQLSKLILIPQPLPDGMNSLQAKAEAWLPILAIPLFSHEESAIQYQMKTGDFGSDSTSYQVFNRNLRRWPEAVVVADLTTSMYRYSTQVFTWFRQMKKANAKAVVFFTDCDSTGRETQQIGTSGQFFSGTSLEIDKVLPLMIKAARNTVNNYNSAENDLEALLYAQQHFPEARHLVLLADNTSPVKDMALLQQITKPVHVILCGSTTDSTQAFQPDYLEIAGHTGGTLHTIEDDINPATLSQKTWIRVGEKYYKYDEKKKQFKLTRFRQRPKRILGLFWW